MSETQWYYARNKKKIGPVSFVQLRRLVAVGELGASDMLLQAGAAKWVEAGSVPGLVQVRAPAVRQASAPERPASTATTVMNTAKGAAMKLLAEAGRSVREACQQTARLFAYGWGLARGRLLARKGVDTPPAQEHSRRLAEQRRRLFPASTAALYRMSAGYLMLGLAIWLAIAFLGQSRRPDAELPANVAPGQDVKVAVADKGPDPAASTVQVEDGGAKALMSLIAPYVNETTEIVGHANIPKLDLKKYFQVAASFAGERQVADIRDFAMAQLDKLLKAGVRHVLAAVNVSDVSGQTPPEVVVVAPLHKNADVSGLLKLIAGLPGFTAKVDKETLVVRFGPVNARAPKERPDFRAGLEALKDKHIQIIAAPSAALRSFVEKQVPALPPELGGGDITLLTGGIRWLGIGYDTSGLTHVLQAKDARTAAELKTLADKGLDMLEKLPDPAGFSKVRPLLDLKEQGERLSLTVNGQALNTMLQSMVVKTRGAAERTQSMNNLKQIGLSMHNYHDFSKSLPARANFDQTGKPLLSWRVHILPLIEQDELYRQFKLDEPWDSPHNKKLIARMPPLYASPLSKASKDGKTTYLALTGKGSMFDGDKGLRLTDVTDGTSNTLMVVEANDTKAVYWTQPEDFPIDTKEPLAGLVNREMKGFLALFTDASVRVIPATIRLLTLRALFTRNGGEKIDDDSVK
jgi:hypothetical protein